MISMTSWAFHALSSAITAASIAGATSLPWEGRAEMDERAAPLGGVGGARAAGRGVAVLGAAARREAGPTGPAPPPHHVHITIGIDADLDLDRTNSFLCDLCDFA